MKPEFRAAALTLLLPGALLSAAPVAAADAAGWQLRLHTRQHSDATALGAGDELRASDLQPRGGRGRQLAYLDDEVRLERRQGAWRWAVLARSRATLVVNDDAIDLYRQVDSGEPLTRDRDWNVQARLRGFSGQGLSVGREHDIGAGWQAGWQLQALVLQRWRERRIQGAVSADAASGAYSFALQSVQRDDRLQFPFQTAPAGHGTALLADLKLGWQAGPWQASATLHDAGALRWRALPRQDALLDTRTAGVDANGFLIYRPLVEGQNSQATARGAAPAWLALAGSRALNVGGQALTAEAGADLLPRFGPLPWLGLRGAVGSAQLGLQWRVHERRLGLHWQWRGLSVSAGTDRLGGGARSRELGVAWHLPL